VDVLQAMVVKQVLVKANHLSDIGIQQLEEKNLVFLSVLTLKHLVRIGGVYLKELPALLLAIISGFLPFES